MNASCWALICLAANQPVWPSWSGNHFIKYYCLSFFIKHNYLSLLIEISFGSYPYSSVMFATKFAPPMTAVLCSAVVTCAKLCSGLITVNGNTAKFSSYQIWNLIEKYMYNGPLGPTLECQRKSWWKFAKVFLLWTADLFGHNKQWLKSSCSISMTKIIISL